MASGWEGVCVAPDDDLFTVSPTWDRLDSGVAGLHVTSIGISRGRQSEFEETGTGTCQVVFEDEPGVLDPTNSTSAYFEKLISRPFAVAIRNPVTDEWFPLFRGTVDECGYDLSVSKSKLQTALTAVDLFDYFSNFELVPGLAGFTTGAVNAAGYVFYEDAAFDDRILAILGDIGLASGMWSVFTGNIIVSESIYSPGDKAMQALQEVVDAEFPTVANHYVDRRGIYQAHGRYARFDPDTVSASASNWVFNRWKVGDNAAALADPDRAKMQAPFGFQLTRKTIRNAALAYPHNTDRADLADYVITDETSRGEHGTRTWTAPDLQVAEETTLGLTAKEHCQYIGDYIVGNYAQPLPRVTSLTVGSERPDGPFGPAAWEFITGVDIGDVVNVSVSRDDGGFDEIDHYVEGLRYEIRPGPGSLDESFPFVKLQVDLSPAAYWGYNPFGDVPT